MSVKQEENSQIVLDNRTRGKSLRKRVPRSIHGEWAPEVNRPDPLSLLQEQDEGRIPHLLPIKYGRMIASPIAILRGSAVVMAPAALAGVNPEGLRFRRNVVRREIRRIMYLEYHLEDCVE